jgi:steroid delta-isomerase
MSVDALVRFFETLSPATVARIADFYAEDARFKDPFNDVRGTAAIRRIFSHMFTQVSEPRFVVGERVVDAGATVLVWDLHFGVRVWGRVRAQVIHGVSHLKFAADGKVTCHRDYWDTGEELYMKLPVLGLLMRALRRRMAA